MAKGMTKPQCLAIEKMAIEIISSVLGDPEDFFEDGGSCLKWIFPHGETGSISLSLICDSKEVGNTYRSTWLACRLDDRTRHVAEDGYTKPRNEIEGGWPYPFTYPSGKYNLFFDAKDMVRNKLDLIHHLQMISAPESHEKVGFTEILEKYSTKNEK